MPIITKSTPSPRESFENSCSTGSSPMGKSTPVQLSMFSPEICEDLPKSTSLRGSRAGRWHSELPGGVTIAQHGPAPARARHSAKQERKNTARNARAETLCGALDELVTQYALIASTHGLPTPAIYGRKPGDLPRTDDLNAFLANRLQARTDLNGSPEYRLQWKFSEMLLGVPIIRLRASARPISDSGFSGWPTPSAQEFHTQDREQLLKRRAECKERTGNGNGFGLTLANAASMAGWPTPMAGSSGTENYNPAGNTDSSRKTVALLTGWPSPKANNHTPAGTRGQGGENLQTVAGWATPTTRDHKDGASTLENTPINGLLGRQVSLSRASTENSAASLPTKRPSLNPRFSLWLMLGPYAIAWARCAERATKLTPMPAPDSSAR